FCDYVFLGCFSWYGFTKLPVEGKPQAFGSMTGIVIRTAPYFLNEGFQLEIEVITPPVHPEGLQVDLVEGESQIVLKRFSKSVFRFFFIFNSISIFNFISIYHIFFTRRRYVVHMLFT